MVRTDNPRERVIDPDGYDVITTAILDLFNEYAEIIGKEIFFEVLGENSGLSFQAAGGAEVISDTKSVTGKITEYCQFPIIFVYRTASTQEYQKLQIQTFLDTLGKWICMEEVKINGENYRLTEYPKLTRGRKITSVRRNNSSPKEPNADGVQDWGLPLYIYYTHEYYRNRK